MAIRFTKYVDIVSGVAGNAAVSTRDLILRVFSINPLIPTGSMVEFDDADEVGEYFGTGSEEYKRAAAYFAWISKSITKAKKIAFARWVNAASAPLVYGNTEDKLLATLTAVTAGAFSLTLGGVTLNATGLDLSGAANLAAAAALLQTKIRTGTGTIFTSATVSYDATRKSFNFVGGDTGAAAISYADGAQSPLAAFGWIDGDGLIVSDGSAVESITATLSASASASDDFGSFLFQPALSLDQVEEAADWNATQNVKFMYLQRVAKADAATWSAALLATAGVALTIASLVADEYPEQIPGTILAATDYTRRNATQNYMFQQFDLTPSVTDDTESDTYDAARVNYYGQTQTAGQQISFYQRGKLMGGNTAPVDQNVYANEQWLKDKGGAAIMALLLALPKVSANTTGRSQLMSVLQADMVQPALFNGVISVGKPLSATNKAYIASVTGDPKAWYQVQAIGYWLDVVIAPYTAEDDTTEWKATWTLVYSKDDTIRKVEGFNNLI